MGVTVLCSHCVEIFLNTLLVSNNIIKKNSNKVLGWSEIILLNFWPMNI